MQPRTKFQKKAVEASKKLPPLTPAQERWAYTKVVEAVGRRSSKGIVTCLDCGEVFYNDTKQKHCTCPACRTRLRIEDTRKQKFNQEGYATYITTCDGLQVIRIFKVHYYAKIGRTPHYFHVEVMQRWIAPDGKHCTLALLRQTMGCYYIDSWIYSTPMELRKENTNNKFYINVYDRIYTDTAYPRMKLIPELKRTGYKGGFYGVNPKTLFCTLLGDNRVESLLKMGHSDLLRLYLHDRGRNLDNYWPSIRIASRNGYKIEDATLWCDYLDALRYFGKDLHNPKYVCPDDLKAAHDYYCSRQQAQIQKEMAAERRRQEEAYNRHMLKRKMRYNEDRTKFSDLVLSDGRIRVRALVSVDDLIAEGQAMHHCVGGYYNKLDSLILSATIDDKRIETVEVSIMQLKVIQCRGACNQLTEYHDRIVELVNSNMRLIEERITA
ncbi:PcfJ domain-containing protein [Alistipes sp. kh20]|uniref:PcfJ domain-containing protein n=1 Tax=Alistipes montrealensis TaxID=2834113 RepID=UPI001BCD6D60|nr:PcfJ domain-containing protein [Alistipes montrealensis]MBS4765811.1 PcfJ domain-containing protein [Alistipes montrealensis]